MGSYLAIGIVDRIYIEKKEKFEKEEEKQQLFQEVSKTIDLSNYEGEEDVDEKTWLFTLKEELLKEHLSELIEETSEMIKQENTWKSFDKKSYINHLIKVNTGITEEVENTNHYLCDDFWPDREYSKAFFNKENEKLQDIMIYPRFIILWINFNKGIEEEKNLLLYLNYFAHDHYKNPLGKCVMFYTLEKPD